MTTKKKPPLEKTITRNILKYLNNLPNCYARKVHGGKYQSGFPDIVCCRDGVAVFIEVKRPGNVATKLQEYELEKWCSAGAITIIAYSVEDVRKVMQ